MKICTLIKEYFMRVINTELLVGFCSVYPDASTPLDAWRQVAKQANWKNLIEIRDTWNRATDPVNGKTVFNIGGNKYRLITTISYKIGLIKIDCILTHEEYKFIKINNETRI